MISLRWRSLTAALGIGRESDRELLEMAKAREADFRAVAAVLMESIAEEAWKGARDRTVAAHAYAISARCPLTPEEARAFLEDGLYRLAAEVGSRRRLPLSAFPHRNVDTTIGPKRGW